MNQLSAGELIRHYRKSAGLTQEQLAQQSGMSVMSIRRYESGERQPRPSQLHAITDALNISFSDMHLRFLKENYVDEIAYYKAQVDEARAIWFSGTVEGQAIIEAYRHLNDEGRKKAVERITELVEIPKYQASWFINGMEDLPEAQEKTPPAP